MNNPLSSRIAQASAEQQLHVELEVIFEVTP